ncbi:MAG: hypothetical protein ACHBN1_34790 [Heteroscytonema crispum UTEX LB 1556]
MSQLKSKSVDREILNPPIFLFSWWLVVGEQCGGRVPRHKATAKCEGWLVVKGVLREGFPPLYWFSRRVVGGEGAPLVGFPCAGDW